MGFAQGHLHEGVAFRQSSCEVSPGDDLMILLSTLWLGVTGWGTSIHSTDNTFDA